ncbi:hypothetical protein HNV12_24210 [Methanococcoides sp. SA1]|nr:hypothetical protein [Methanococcoides sp. SA1]
MKKKFSYYLVGKRKMVDFSKPVYVAERDDTNLLRKNIIDRSYAEWKSATRKL